MKILKFVLIKFCDIIFLALWNLFRLNVQLLSLLFYLIQIPNLHWLEIPYLCLGVFSLIKLLGYVLLHYNILVKTFLFDL